MPLTIHHPELGIFREDDFDTIRIGKTRVTLDTLIAVFRNGETPEQIAQNFPVLDLADIYAALGYYLRYQAEVDAYLETRQREADQIIRVAQESQKGLREMLLARRAAQRTV